LFSGSPEVEGRGREGFDWDSVWGWGSIEGLDERVGGGPRGGNNGRSSGAAAPGMAPGGVMALGLGRGDRGGGGGGGEDRGGAR
jgi:hypothetical protein